MGQPGMRVTVDAAMRARDVSRPWTDDDPADRSPATGPAVSATPATSATPTTPATSATPGGADHIDRDQRDGGDRDQDDRPQRQRRGKAERRRLSKRHARARR